MSVKSAFWCLAFGPYIVLLLPLLQSGIPYTFWVNHYFDYDVFWFLSLAAFLGALTIWCPVFAGSPRASRVLVAVPVLSGVLVSGVLLYMIDIFVDFTDHSHPWIFAQLGSPWAQVKLARAILDDNIPNKDKLARRWLEKAAQSGSVDGQVTLYKFLIGDPLHGRIDHTTFPEGLKWLRAAALQGDPLAENDLGCLYQFNIVTPHDSNGAGYWITKSLEHSRTNHRLIDDYYPSFCKPPNSPRVLKKGKGLELIHPSPCHVHY